MKVFFRTLREEPLLAGLVLLAAAIWILKWVFISTTYVVDDEAYYWVWSRHLSAGYFDHPPFLAWFIWLSSHVFGQTGFGIRAGGLVLFAALSAVLYFFGRGVRDERTGIILGLLPQLTPFYFGASFIITTDTPLVFLLFSSVIAYGLAFFKNEKWFYLAGPLLGLAFLSKVTAAFTGLGIFLFPFLFPETRRHLVRPAFWLSFALVGLVVSPFVIWNIRHDWIFLRHVFHDLLGNEANIRVALDLWGAQFAFYFPLLVSIAIGLTAFTFWKGIVSLLRRESPSEEIRWNVFLIFSVLPPLIYLVPKSIKNHLEANWPAFAFPGLLLMAGLWLASRWKSRPLRILYFTNYFLAGIIAALAIFHVWRAFIPFHLDPTHRYFFFSVFQNEFKDYYREKMDPSIRIAGLNYQIPSVINLYTRPKLEATCIYRKGYHATSYIFWYPEKDLVGKDLYIVDDRADYLEQIKPNFDQMIFLTNFTPYRGKGPMGTTFQVYLGKNFHGTGFDPYKMY